MLELIILSLLQGVTEFLPISSSSHIIIISKFFNFTQENLLTNISLHIGSFLAVLVFFRNDLINFVKNKKIFLLVLTSSLPIMIVGFFLTKTNVINVLQTLEVIGWTTITFGILLYISDKFKQNKFIKNNLGLSDAIFIGIVHTISLIPGVSRSGIAITAGRLLGYSRVDSAKISFLLSIPTLFAVSIYGIFEIYSNSVFEINNFNIMFILLSFFFSYITIKYFLIFLKKFSLTIFVMYRVILGIIIISYVYQ